MIEYPYCVYPALKKVFCERQYTRRQLADAVGISKSNIWWWLSGNNQHNHIDDGLGCTFEGKTYTAYEATQEQRKVERTIRKLKREKAAYKAAGLHEEEQAVNIRMQRLNAKYKAFSAAAGLPEQRERMKVLY